MDDYLDRLNTTWERYGGRNTCSVVQIIDRASGRRTGARIYPQGCKVREVVERGFDYEKKTKFDKQGRMKGKMIETTSKHRMKLIPWPPELENTNIYEPATIDLHLYPNLPTTPPYPMLYDTGAEVSMTDWNGMRALIPEDKYDVISYSNKKKTPVGVKGIHWKIGTVGGVTGPGPVIIFKNITIGAMISPGKFQKVKDIDLWISLEGTPVENRDPNKTVFKVMEKCSKLVGTDIMKQLTNYRVRFQNANQGHGLNRGQAVNL
jgi:hypothetical protein